MAAVFIAKVPKMIASHVPSAAIQAGLPESPVTALHAAIGQGASAMEAVPGISTSIQLAVSQALPDAYAAVAVGGVGLIAAICMRDHDKLLTSHVPRTIPVSADKSGLKKTESQGAATQVLKNAV